MRDITVRFEDVDNYTLGLINQPSFFIKILKSKYNVTVLESGKEEPDILFFSNWGYNNIKWTNCFRIFFSGESVFPNFNLCDYAITTCSVGTSDRVFYLPIYVFYNDLLYRYENNLFVKPKVKLNERGFCSTVITNADRDNIFFSIFNELNQYKKVYSGGLWNNNIGYQITNKLDFISSFKFNIAFENKIRPNYITEKLLEAKLANTIPIYWGDQSVKHWFGEGSYININDFSSVKSAVNFIIETDKNDQRYLEILNNRVTIPISYDLWCERLLDYFSHILDAGTKIFSRRQNNDFNNSLILYKMKNSFFGKSYRIYKHICYKSKK